MAKRDEGPNPFWWVVLGFICGVLATLGALIAYGGGIDSGEGAPPASVSPADEALDNEPPSNRAPAAAPEAAPSDPAAGGSADSAFAGPSPPPPAAVRPPPPVEDPQVAEDAAAAGMTTRSPRN